VVKRARHNQYKVKKATDIGRRHEGPATVRLFLLPIPPADAVTSRDLVPILELAA
jgi:hypothetical protein